MPVIVGKDTKFLQRITCSKCGTISEYWPNEVYHNGKTDEGCKIFVITCPGCGKEVRTNS